MQVMKDISVAVSLLKVAQCPQCDGSGTLIYSGYGTEAGCCGNTLSNGECCGNAIPIEVQTQEVMQCQWCAEREELISKYDEELEV